ncbi:hypothetical protein [Zunongwangia endophytica]|uniref:Uncharacterized protein n=1 Tax=Zunongwangia endophytica TaxID=1808945 RepID=A0ABV8H874_9FLAO|nr:hypothetical protein [Zunongwangia endophytica]MDN3593272.1 hypothetical protein [Zunongwangia endophytica]MDN3594227.1 hypothetical protein [Zunongwangia endophytica]
MAKNNKIKLKISQRISDHLIQGFLIFLSVFFAFWLTEYRETQKDSKTLEVSIRYIASEIQYNHNRIEYIYEYHSNLLTEIDSLEGQNDSNWMQLDGSDLRNWEGLQTPMLRSTAYQTYLNSNIIDNVDFELAKSLTNIYYAQSIIEGFDNSIIESAITDTEGLMSLPKLKYLTLVYLGALPDVMKEYQLTKRNWLDEYGYDIAIKNDSLKREVNRRMNITE